MGRAQEQQGPADRTGDRVQKAQTGRGEREGREGCRVQGGMGWPGPVGKELQCVTQRLAGGDPLCDATMRAVRDGLVWVGGCDETDQRKDTIEESSHMQLQDRRRGRARMNPATCQPLRPGRGGDGQSNTESSS